MRASAEFPRGPGKESNDDQQRNDSVSSQTVTSAPEQEELEDQQDQQGDGDEEWQTVTVTSIDVVVWSTSWVRSWDEGVDLTVTVELVEPDDDQGDNEGKYNVEHIARGFSGSSDIATVHTIDKQNTNNRDGDVDEPRIINKSWDTIWTSTNVLGNISLGSGEEVEYNGQEDDTQNQVGPEDTATELFLQIWENLAQWCFHLWGWSTNWRGGGIGDLSDCGSTRHFFTFYSVFEKNKKKYFYFSFT